MISQEIRRRFLQYFKDKGHTPVPSSPVIPHDDPTLLFINAGMNQFKDVFLGKSLRDYVRAASSQKCVRVGGKHNDLENVGHTSRHLTFFEMLGNFSFGDYFKKEAIAYAWEVTTQIFGYDPIKIWATVFHEDEEAFELWRKYLPAERIARLGEKDNFWAMGDTGPCGPCSELLYDRGSSYGEARSPSEDFTGERYLEFWNLVFMQFNRDATGTLHPLPKKSVDTGAGLERVVSLKMGAESVFETDILRGLIAQVENVSKQPYHVDHLLAPAFRVIADHVRTLAFAISDGVQPSNIERGYVLRKVLRRAVRYGRQLGMDRPFLSSILPRLIDLMGDDYPALKSSQGRIEEILLIEEESFLKTLRRGGNILNQIMQNAQKAGIISGEDSFKLKDTYGLPLEEIMLLAKDGGLTVDLSRFEELEHEAKERSREARKTTEQTVKESLFEQHLEKHGPTHFLGYQQLSVDGIVLGLMRDGKEVQTLYPGEEGVVLLDQTPFYAEKGGQVGDQGILSWEEGFFTVMDSQAPFTDVVAHLGVVAEGELRIGQRLTATVNEERRQKIANNHSATHLLHWALQIVLGAHIRQAGSVVDSHRLRFDFTHHKPLSSEELASIEDLVNSKIRENRGIHVYELSYADVQKQGEIKQFFGEKYGSTVRVVDIDYSKELCGGTHTSAVGTIGYFRIVKEGSIAAGVRRIEAVTGEEAEKWVRENESLLSDLAESFKIQPSQLPERVEKMLQENKEVASEVSRLRKEMLGAEVERLTAQLTFVGAIPFLAFSLPLEPQELKSCADLIMGKVGSLVLLLIGEEKEKCTVICRVSSDLVGQGIKASELMQQITPLIDGKGGGKADNAQGGGTNLSGISEALKLARAWIEQKHF